MSSAAQIAANQKNAQLSCGPSSPAGKAKASLNAVKSGLTGRTVLLPTEQAAEYERHIQDYQQELKPVGRRESDLVQSIADSAWRLNRIPGLELAFYAKGQSQFAEAFNDHDPSARAGLIELQTLVTYEKQLRNLQLQEARLRRGKEKDLAELRQLQQERFKEEKRKELEPLDRAARRYIIAYRENKTFDPKENGFEFSLDQIKRYLSHCSPEWRYDPLLENRAA